MNTNASVVPSIQVYVAAGCDANVLQSIRNGIEEESVPFDLVKHDSDDAYALAYEGAQNSVVEVGVGVDTKGNLVVHYKKLPYEKPLFTTNYRIEPEKVRDICANGARLVKGTPFVL